VRGDPYRQIAVFIALLFLGGGCVSKGKESDRMKLYREAISRTVPTGENLLPPDSEEEQSALDRFKEMYADFSRESVRTHIGRVYAEDAYFADPLRSVQGIEQIEEYFLKSAETFNVCTFAFDDIAGNSGEHYVRWRMHLVLKRYPNDPIDCVGMSHLRFNRDGKVAFHQDYWDAGVLYERFTLVGSVIRSVKKKL
jgi:hypothetical protein